MTDNPTPEQDSLPTPAAAIQPQGAAAPTLPNDSSTTPETASNPIAPLIPIRWNLWTLLVLTFLLGMQFALQRWFGILAGLAVPLAIIGVGFFGFSLFALARAIGSANKRPHEQDEFWLQRITLTLALYGMLVLLAGGGQLAWEATQLWVREARVTQAYGFQASSTFAWYDNNRVPALEVQIILPGSRAEQGGLQIGDRILLSKSTKDEYFQTLIDRQAESIRMNILPAGSSIFYEDKDLRAITIPADTP